METNKQSVLLRKKISDFKNKITNLVMDCNQVYLTTHKHPDYDAVASLGAMALICKKLKKAPYLIIDHEDYENLSYDLSEMLDKVKETFVVIDLDDFEANKVENSLLITLDVNKNFMTPLKNNYKDFKDIIVIDHHDEDENTIKTKNKLVLHDVSSCSEILYWLLKQYRITPNQVDFYNFLLAGIYLDTDKGNKNTYQSTRECIGELIDKKGVDQLKVEMLFAPDFESDRKVQRLVDKTKWITIRYAIGIGDNETYTKEEVAKAADYALRYVCEAAIYLGKDENGYYNISARSNRGNVDISELMHELNNGGGNECSASCPPLYVDADGIEEKEVLSNKIKDIIYHRKKRKM